MNYPNQLTILRIILSPVFFIVFFVPVWFNIGEVLSVFLLIIIFTIIEVSDVMDGYIARKYGQVTEMGKVMDPFADVFSRITYFLCFTGVGIMPIWIFVIILYRELAITFLRMVMISRGIAMAASVWGKLKAVMYAVSGIFGMVVVLHKRLPFDVVDSQILLLFAGIIFFLAAAASVASFLTYIKAIWKGDI